VDNLKFTVLQISQVIDGQIEGDQKAVIDKFSKIEEGKKGGLSFVGDSRYEHYIYKSNATAVIVKKDFIPKEETKCILIRVNNPKLAFIKLLQFYVNLKPQRLGIAKNATIPKGTKLGIGVYIGEGVVLGENVSIGDNTKIYPQSYIGDNVKIGNDTILYAGIKIYDDCFVGSDCIIHAGAVIGADGFGYILGEENTYEKIPQLGNVVIEDEVEIGANTCIDRATMDSTIIRKGTKIDNLTQIAHNCEIGENTILAACCGVAGSVKIGKNCLFGGQVGIKDHVVIGNNVSVGSQSGIHNNVKDNENIIGTPALSAKKSLKIFGSLPLLPDLIEKVNQLEKQQK
jgi:UDP-3-O-[3-hydroxymyristoyl] glucosamine N-acyltransferase